MTSLSKKLPVVFVGHGSPMNAIASNAFTRSLTDLGLNLPRPRVILMISAHWLTEGTFVTGMGAPKTIHDFYGFPEELFSVQYPAPGLPSFAEALGSRAEPPLIGLDQAWGLDHGAWSVLTHMYPKADVPVVQLSIDQKKPFQYHFELGRSLARLREQGVLIVGSGNIVHNLRRIRWETDAKAFDWADEFDAWSKSKIESGDFTPLVNHALDTEAGKLSVPTTDHYLPLLYTLGAATPGDSLSWVYEGMQNASISMRTFTLG